MEMRMRMRINNVPVVDLSFLHSICFLSSMTMEFDDVEDDEQRRRPDLFEANASISSTNFYSIVSSRLVQQIFSSDDFLHHLHRSTNPLSVEGWLPWKISSFLLIASFVLLLLGFLVATILSALLHRKSSFPSGHDRRRRRRSVVFGWIYFLLNGLFLVQLMFLLKNLL